MLFLDYLRWLLLYIMEVFKIFYATIKERDVANGLGIRVSLFVSGCPHHCKGCFNPETWNYFYGSIFTKETADKLIRLLKRPYIRGLSLLGGEPLSQGKTLYDFVKRVRDELPNKDIWLYSGFRYEEVKDNPILDLVDVMIDGEFIQELKDVRLRFRGSSNQRIIDVKKTKQKGVVILYDFSRSLYDV